MLAEELKGLSGSVTGELDASFWIEGEGKQADLRLTTKRSWIRKSAAN